MNPRRTTISIIAILMILSSVTVVQAQAEPSLLDNILSSIIRFFDKLSPGTIYGGNGCYAEYGWRAGRGVSVIYNADGVEIGYVDPTTINSVGAYLQKLDPPWAPTGTCATKYGTTTIMTTPANGILYVDEVYLGIAPQTAKKYAGKYLIRAVMEGYPDKTVITDIVVGQNTNLNIEFIAAPTPTPTPITTPIIALPPPPTPIPPIVTTPAPTATSQVLNPVETTAAPAVSPTSTPALPLAPEVIQTQPGAQGTTIPTSTPPGAIQSIGLSETTQTEIVAGATLIIIVLILRLMSGKKTKK